MKQFELAPKVRMLFVVEGPRDFFRILPLRKQRGGAGHAYTPNPGVERKPEFDVNVMPQLPSTDAAVAGERAGLPLGLMQALFPISYSVEAAFH